MLGLLRRRWWIGTGIKISGHVNGCGAAGRNGTEERASRSRR